MCAMKGIPIQIINKWNQVLLFLLLIRYRFQHAMINTYKTRSQALGYTLWFSLFSLKLSIFRFSASILTFSTQNHLILTYFTHLDTTHFFYKYYNIQHAHRFFHLGVHVPFYLHCWGYIQIFGGAISNSSFGGTKKINCIFSMQGRAPCCF